MFAYPDLSLPILPCPVLPWPYPPCPALPCPVLPYPDLALPYLTLTFTDLTLPTLPPPLTCILPTLSCLALSCHTLPCRILALPYPILTFSDLTLSTLPHPLPCILGSAGEQQAEWLRLGDKANSRENDVRHHHIFFIQASLLSNSLLLPLNCFFLWYSLLRLDSPYSILDYFDLILFDLIWFDLIASVHVFYHVAVKLVEVSSLSSVRFAILLYLCFTLLYSTLLHSTTPPLLTHSTPHHNHFS